MAGKVRADLVGLAHSAHVEPQVCPGVDRQRQGEGLFVEAHCYGYSDAYGERCCPFLSFVASGEDITHRIPDLLRAGQELRLQGRSQLRVQVMCQLQKGGTTPSGC